MKAPRRWRCHVGSAKRMMSGGLPPLAGLLPKSSLRADFACALLFRRMNDNAVSACAAGHMIFCKYYELVSKNFFLMYILLFGFFGEALGRFGAKASIVRCSQNLSSLLRHAANPKTNLKLIAWAPATRCAGTQLKGKFIVLGLRRFRWLSRVWRRQGHFDMLHCAPRWLGNEIFENKLNTNHR